MAVPKSNLDRDGKAGASDATPSVSGIELVSTTKLRDFLTSAAESPTLDKVGIIYVCLTLKLNWL